MSQDRNDPTRTNSTPSSDAEAHGGEKAGGKYRDEPFVVGIGASADGLKALKRFLEHLPADTEMAFVVVQHLSPDHESNLGTLLDGYTEIPVDMADDGVAIEGNHLYVIPVGKQLGIRDGSFETGQIPDLHRGRHTIDFFFRALAEAREHRAAGLLLSGAGTDGTAGLRAIREHGGLTMAQDPDEAGVGTMPRHAVDAGVVDFVLSVDEMPGRLREVTRANRRFDIQQPPEALENGESEALRRIMRLLHKQTGNDLSNYKRPTVLRRVGRRMQVCEVDSLEAYLRYLEESSSEVDRLFEELLIGVTRFFRDQEAWEALDGEVIPELFRGKTPDDEIRVWVPGCATGEEAYTVGMLLEQYAETVDHPPDIKVFATDIDRGAIAFARRALYPSAIASDVPSEMLERYFRREDEEYRVVKRLRNDLLFAVQNALADPPFSNLDLVTCRNFLIYLEPEAQEQLLEILHYGLRDEGFLMLGSSETTTQGAELYETVDKENHLYRALPESQARIHVPRRAFGYREPEQLADEAPTVEVERDLEKIHRESLLEQYAPPSVLVDADSNELLHVIGDVERYLRVPPGRPSSDVLEMVDSELRAQVRTLLFEAVRTPDEPARRKVSLEDDHQLQLEAVAFEPSGSETAVVELSFVRLADLEGADREGDRTGEEGDSDGVVSELEDQLEQTRARLQSTIEEYEASNEKLRASNEELMSMNEELQSTTEELETSKEELQSMNEELQTVNDELNDKIEQLDSVNSDLRNLMRSTDIGTIFLDRDLTIKRFTEPVTEYFNLIRTDEGRPFAHITHELQTDQLVDDARRVLEELTTIEREVECDGGRHFMCRALPYLNVDDRVDGVVLTFVDITERKRIRERLAANEQKFRTVFESAANPMFIYQIRQDGSPAPFTEVNGLAVEKTGIPRDELTRMTIDEIFTAESFDADHHFEALDRDGEFHEELMLRWPKEGEAVPCEVQAKQMRVDDTSMVVEVVRDISDRKRYERALVESKERAEELAELRSMFLSTLSHDVRSPLTAIMTMAGILRRKMDEEDREMVDRIERSTEQLRKILDSILRMAKLEAGDTFAVPEEFDLVGTIEDVLELHEPLADEEHLSIAYRGPDSSVDVELDSRFMTQILSNLVDNAVKYTDEGEVVVELSETADRVRIEVSDTGPGIPEEEQKEIFERFETGSGGAARDSIGLGLAITRMLTDAMDGEISVESAPGEGSTFAVEFPRKFEE
jgi:two-component system CheB/CheR fusion protein